MHWFTALLGYFKSLVFTRKLTVLFIFVKGFVKKAECITSENPLSMNEFKEALFFYKWIMLKYVFEPSVSQGIFKIKLDI